MPRRRSYDLGWRSVLPNWVYRLTLSLFASLRLLSTLLVSKQLRRTIMQLTKYQGDADYGEIDGVTVQSLLARAQGQSRKPPASSAGGW